MADGNIITDTRERLINDLRERVLVIDGAMGTMIQQTGLSEGDFRGRRFKNKRGRLSGCNDLLCVTRPDIITGIHRAFPNRYLAHFVPFLNKHQKKEEIQRLILDEFSRFLHRNILQYNRRELPLHFVGSIAYHFAGLLETAVRQNGFQPGKILKSPIPGLVEYHASIK